MNRDRWRGTMAPAEALGTWEAMLATRDQGIGIMRVNYAAISGNSLAIGAQDAR